MENSHKIRVKVGSAEFEAEGSEETVNAQYEKFLAMLGQMKGNGAEPHIDPSTEVLPDSNNSPRQQITGEFLSRAFAVDKGGTVSLLALPPKGENQEADALILILYGFRRVREQNVVMVDQLIEAARQSGVETAGRVARVLDPRSDLITRSGIKRGTRYGLNNRGAMHAENLLIQMFR